jgi:hypothetical protein
MGFHAPFAPTMPGGVADDNWTRSGKAKRAFAHNGNAQLTQDDQISA